MNQLPGSYQRAVFARMWHPRLVVSGLPFKRWQGLDVSGSAIPTL